jgi:hypothetical protein
MAKYPAINDLRGLHQRLMPEVSGQRAGWHVSNVKNLIDRAASF